MAGTPVRSFGRSFASVRALPLGFPVRAGSVAERALDADHILLVIVVVQLLAAGLLIARNALDPLVAVCLSAGLIAAAALYAARRIGAPRVSEAAIGTVAASETISAVKAEQARSSEAWADLMARISHEIRTPLNAVIGFSDLMDREIFGPLGHERYTDYAAHIKDSGEALLKSAEDTLALSSLLVAAPASDRATSFSLGEILWDAWRPLDAQAVRRGISLAIVGDARLDVVGERRICRQAFLNLLTEVLNRAPDEHVVRVHAWSENDMVRLTFETATASQWRHETTPSLAVCLARTLLERAGSPLSIMENRAAATWKAQTTLVRPVQDDFFGREG